MHIRARRALGIYHQQPSVFRKMSVEDNIISALETLNLSKQKQSLALEKILEDFGLIRIRHIRSDLLF